ncbi:hypothetical protein EK0264_17165 [Epidermidibacterium keratini]|uniref:Uncharacterized protein n=1 Tax=Epidermidibacterium keratini TaxID=1891644 RepID=A0A7L4YS08_9ACTN|nr:hypothetical protein [Epidermidibacterium keratini]QHC01838.1 hypothetical protein EK0264_17165 [Epidermidibacterium keratini]
MAPTAALIELAAQNSQTGFGLVSALAAIASFGGLTYWRVGRATARVEDDFRGRNPMRGTNESARRAAVGAAAALAIGAAGAGIVVPAAVPDREPVAQMEQADGLPRAESYSERLQVALDDLEALDSGATDQLRKVGVYDGYVEIIYATSAGGDFVYSTQSRESQKYDGPFVPGTFALSDQQVLALDGMVKAASAEIDVSYVEYQAETDLMSPTQGYDVQVTLWNTDPKADIDRIEGNPSGEIAGAPDYTSEGAITQALRSLGGWLTIDWYGAAYSEFGITGATGLPISEAVSSTNTVYARVASGATSAQSGTISEKSGRYPIWMPDQQPVVVGGTVAMEPFLDEAFPLVLADLQQRVGAAEADMSSFSMRVGGDPDDPMYGVVVYFNSIGGPMHRYTLDGQYVGPVQ